MEKPCRVPELVFLAGGSSSSTGGLVDAIAIVTGGDGRMTWLRDEALFWQPDVVRSFWSRGRGQKKPQAKEGCTEGGVSRDHKGLVPSVAEVASPAGTRSRDFTMPRGRLPGCS